jgi:hypothetical protein
MRVMNVPLFARKLEIVNLEELYRTRLNQRNDCRAAIGVPLIGYMGWPNDLASRQKAMEMLGRWVDMGERGPAPKDMVRIHRDWARVADVVHLHVDLRHGRHQEGRGGASIGKSIFLFSKTATSRGTGQASAWKSWHEFKDVAHLIAATILICADMRTRQIRAPLGLELQQLLPIRVVLMLPELVLAVGLAFQEYGLNDFPKGGTEPMFDPETLWRIPADINVSPLSPPIRKIRSQDCAVLNSRRAGNRGRAGRETRPVC